MGSPVAILILENRAYAMMGFGEVHPRDLRFAAVASDKYIDFGGLAALQTSRR